MNKGGGGDQCVAELFWVRDGKLGGEAGGCDIDGMDAAGECGKNLGFQPGSQDGPFGGIPSLRAQNTGFDFMDCDDREEHGGG